MQATALIRAIAVVWDILGFNIFYEHEGFRSEYPLPFLYYLTFLRIFVLNT